MRPLRWSSLVAVGLALVLIGGCHSGYTLMKEEEERLIRELPVKREALEELVASACGTYGTIRDDGSYELREGVRDQSERDLRPGPKFLRAMEDLGVLRIDCMDNSPYEAWLPTKYEGLGHSGFRIGYKYRHDEEFICNLVDEGTFLIDAAAIGRHGCYEKRIDGDWWIRFWLW